MLIFKLFKSNLHVFPEFALLILVDEQDMFDSD